MPQGVVMNEITVAQTGAIIREFPFVKNYAVDVRRLDKPPRVERIDLTLLAQRAWEDSAIEGNGVGYRFILIDKNGRELGEAKRDFLRKEKFNLFKWSTWNKITHVPAQSVHEAIKELPVPDELAFVLEIADSHESDRYSGFDYGSGMTVVIHKVPSKVKFSEWIESLEVQASKELSKEISEVDAL